MLKIRFGILVVTMSLLSMPGLANPAWADEASSMEWVQQVQKASQEQRVPEAISPSDAKYNKPWYSFANYQKSFNNSVDGYYENRDKNLDAANRNLEQYFNTMTEAQAKLSESEKRLADIEAKAKARKDTLTQIEQTQGKLNEDLDAKRVSGADFIRRNTEIAGQRNAAQAQVIEAEAQAARARSDFETASRQMREHQGRIEAQVGRNYKEALQAVPKLDEGSLATADPAQLKAQLAGQIKAADNRAKDEALKNMAKQFGDRLQEDFLKSGDLFRDLNMLKGQYKDEARFNAIRAELSKRMDNTLMGQYVQERAQDVLLRSLCSPDFNNKVAACQAGKLDQAARTEAPAGGDARVSERLRQPAAGEPALGSGLKLKGPEGASGEAARAR